MQPVTSDQQSLYVYLSISYTYMRLGQVLSVYKNITWTVCTNIPSANTKVLNQLKGQKICISAFCVNLKIASCKSFLISNSNLPISCQPPIASYKYLADLWKSNNLLPTSNNLTPPLKVSHQSPASLYNLQVLLSASKSLMSISFLSLSQIDFKLIKKTLPVSCELFNNFLQPLMSSFSY
jgi:hypothetical protein